MKAAARSALEREKTATKILAAAYDTDRDAIVVELSTAATLVVPRAKIPGFRNADPAALADLAIAPGAETLWSDTVDDGVLLEQLIEIAVGARTILELSGVIRGRVRSEARAVSARQNGRKGGRPRKPPTSE
jgi:hypothetical protein